MEPKDNTEKLELTYSQQLAFKNLLSFLEDREANVFILKGYAGTGKTTLMKELIREMTNRELSFKLLASTGRAAKILSNATGCETRTVHSQIYSFADINQDLENVVKKRENNLVDDTGQLLLNFELNCIEPNEGEGPYLYIVDEASMVADAKDNQASQALFGSGRLLYDLFQYDQYGKFIFVGDACQLPPVNESLSPALDASYLRQNYGMKVYESELTQIVRQSEDNDLVLSSQKLRHLYFNPQKWKWAKFPFKGYKNIHILSSQTELISKYIEKVRELGFNKATLVCSTNRQANMATQIIRPAFGHQSSLLEPGDLLLVTQNNLLTNLMNGDLVIVEKIGEQQYRAGLTFVPVTVKELFTQKTNSLLMIAEVLYGNLTNITQDQQRELMIDFYIRMRKFGIKQKSDAFMLEMAKDPYLNALRAVFGYSLTCHKSQGGEWDYVFLDIPRKLPGLPKPYVYQWVYTAMTRARKDLYVVYDFWVM